MLSSEKEEEENVVLDYNKAIALLVALLARMLDRLVLIAFHSVSGAKSG